MLRYLKIMLLFLSPAVSVFAQPCLSGWNHRAAVTIDNATNPSSLTNFQVMVEVNTATLVLNGKARVDGGDIRMTDNSGASLSFWIETGTYNTSQTRIWTKVPSIAANGSATIFLFYGNPSASIVSNGNSTFELFDDFTGTFVDPSKWSVCNSGTITVSGGKISMTATTALTSVNALSVPVRIGMNVSDFNFANDGSTYIGLINNGTQTGYIGGVRNVSGTTRTSHKRVQPPGTCYTFDNESLSASTVSPIGSWEFWWPSTGDQRSVISGVPHNSTNNTIAPAGSLNAIVGNADMNGVIGVDYLYIRKYTSTDPVATAGTELNINIPAIQASNNGPICEGQDLIVSVTDVPGATYSWKDAANNTVSTDREATLTAVTAAQAGNYTVTVSIPVGCSSSSTATAVQISPATVTGTLGITNTVCLGSNNGTITLTGKTGNVVRWETSQTGSDPWSTINNTTTSLAYTNLISTAHYRTVVKSGVCAELNSNIVVITVDPVTVTGEITGTANVCEGTNTGQLRVVGRTGDVVRWESSTNNGSTWVGISNTAAILSFADLAGDTQYRTVIKSGVCPQSFTPPFSVNVNPLPAPSFTADPECLGDFVEMKNTSSVSEGTITGYLWEFGDGNSSASANPQHAYLTGGTKSITLTATTLASCSKSITQPVTVYAQPSVNFSASQTCDGFPTDFTNQSTISIGAIASYTWDFGDGTGSSLSSPQKQYFNAGTYLVVLTALSDNGCTKSFSKNITVDGLPVSNFSTGDVCLGEDMVFSNASFYNAGPMTYEWDFGDGNESVATSPSHLYANAGIYQVKLVATTHRGCKDSVSRSAQVRTLIGADAGSDSTISKGFSIQLKASGGVEYLWSPAEGLNNPTLPNPIATPAVTTIYTVLVTDPLGCTATDKITLTVEDDFILEAMNVLTPNGDGVNDTWKIKNIDNYGSANVYVYDRNGAEVFSAHTYQNDWKGNHGNDILPDGTYYYLVKFTDSKVAYTGSLTILRNTRK